MVGVRPATAADAAAVTAVFLASRAATLPWLPPVHSAEQTRGFIEHAVIGRQQVRVAVDGDDVVGFAALTPGHLEHLYLAPDRRRQGIGTALFAQVRQECPAGDLWLFQRNTAALAFYERHGCRVVEATDGTRNEEREPDLRLAWGP